MTCGQWLCPASSCSAEGQPQARQTIKRWRNHEWIITISLRLIRDRFAMYCAAHQTAGRPRRSPGLSGIRRDLAGFSPLNWGIFQRTPYSAVVSLVSRLLALPTISGQILAARVSARCTRAASLAKCGNHQRQGVEDLLARQHWEACKRSLGNEGFAPHMHWSRNPELCPAAVVR